MSWSLRKDKHLWVVAALLPVAALATQWSHLAGVEAAETLNLCSAECNESILGFEDEDSWSGSAVAGASDDTSEGSHALIVKGHGFTMFESDPIVSLGFAPTRLSFDVKLPENQPNPDWLGQVLVHLHLPSAALNNYYIAEVPLTGRPTGEYVTLSYDLPTEMSNALGETYMDLRIRTSLNVPQSDEDYLFDNLRFELACADSGEFVASADICNGRLDCSDGTDESSCQTFTCDSGEEVLALRRCDGVAACSDLSDELNCEDSFICDDGSAQVAALQVCDGISDCADGSDESESIAGCEVETCDDGGDLLASKFCDGFDDCSDGSDEDRCGEFQCQEGPAGVLVSQVCNGIADCMNGRDESDCEGFVPCADGSHGVMPGSICDGRVHCLDGSDELDCAGHWTCADGKHGIVPWNRCNGVVDCLDQSDELDCE